MPRSLRAALVAAAVLAVPSAAHAALPWSPCSPAGYECTAFDVALDRSRTVPGTVSLFATRVRATNNPRNVALLTLAGGPGQAATPLAVEFASALAPGLADRDLLVFDQRGTGRSSSLRCAAINRGGSALRVASRCAAELGARRAFYRTAETVADIEDLRVAAGYDKLVLYGVSYGTKVALAYAASYPDRVEALVLDSVVLPEGPDPLRAASFQAVPRVLGELCGGGECRGITDSVRSDVRALARRLRTTSVRGTVVTTSGRKLRVRMLEEDLIGLLIAGDLNPALRAELPGSVRAALRGDARAVLRLAVRSAGLELGYQESRADSRALFLATVCEEAPFRWTRGASVTTRAREITAAARTINRSRLGGFSHDALLGAGVAPLCLGWPEASPAPAAPAPLPAVPTLILNGRADLRTPLEDAQRVAARIPGARVVPLPFTGHSVLGTDLSECSGPAVAAFFTGAPPTTCSADDNPFSPTPAPPRSLRAVKPLGSAKGLRGRTLAAVRATILDARRQVIGSTLAFGERPRAVGGLRSGRATVSGDSIDLRAYEYVPGVTLTGRVTEGGQGTVRVRGTAAARGTVSVAESGAATGTLGGRRVTGSFVSAARKLGTLPTMDEIEARP